MVDLHGGGPQQPGGKAYEVSRKAGSLIHESSPLRKVAPFAGRAALGADVAANFNDYKIDDPSVDSSASGTFNALRQGDFAGAGRSLSKGMLETGMDLGSYAANTADIFVPGQPFSQGYNKMLRSHFGDQLVDNSGNGPAPTPAAPTTPTLRAPTAFTPGQTTRGERDRPGASGETLRGAFGNFSPAGTFADGFTDMGGGIARNGSSFTNIGANGLPTAMSGRDTRTPDQIANGERIKAETARVVAEAGGLGNLQRQNALTAANLRDQNSGAMNFGGMTALGTGMRGNMRVSDSAGSDRDTGSMADMVRRSGVRMTPATLRQAMQGDIQLRVNAESNETSRANNAASNAASLRTATMTNETSRTNNQDSNRTSEANNLRSNATQLETAALPARLQLQAGQQKRAAVSEALRLSGGDQAAAAQALSAAGYTDVAKDLADQASAEQAAAKGAVEFNRNLTAASSVVTDDKGNEVVSPARQAVNASALRQMVSNYDQLTPREKVAAEAQYRPALNILNGMNDRREDTLFKKFGWDQAPAHTTLPDGLRGAHLEAVGPWEGMMTSGAERGDYALRLPDKTTRYINAGRISQAEKQFLKERGVTLGEK